MNDMTRKYAKDIDESIKEHLQLLINEHTTVRQYQAAFTDLGKYLAKQVNLKIRSCENSPVTVVLTAEDADYLGKGFVEEFKKISQREIYLVCFWNDHKQISTGEQNKSIAPPISEYLQPGYEKSNILIVLKSVISGSCVVRLNILSLYNRMENISDIHVVSPVVLEQADTALKSNFPNDFSSKIQFTWFAQDDQKADYGEVLPGIGGQIYEKLGLRGKPLEIKYIPRTILQLM